MLFFRHKQKSDELLPPPPPDLDAELEEGLHVKPKFFDETVEPEKTQAFPEETEFTDLIEDLEGEEPVKVSIRKDMTIGKKSAKNVKPKLKEIKLPKKLIDNLEMPKSKSKKTKSRDTLPKESFNDMPDLKDHDPELPEENFLENTTETFDDFNFRDIETGFGNLSKGLDKPKEVLEAEEEIKGAIDKIKSKEKPSFFKSLFAKKQNVFDEKKPVNYPSVSKPLSAGSLSLVQSKIQEAKQSLMKLDVEGAKTTYIEIMKFYNTLKPEDQAKVYQDIRELYFERKSAESFNI